MKKFDPEEIKRVISEKYHWGPSSDWTNFHFKELSRLIEDTTGDRISEETLKRIFGKRKVSTEYYQPQAFSQMALIKFVESIGSGAPEERSVRKKWNKKHLLSSFSALVAIFFILASILFFKNSGRFSKKASFSCKNKMDYLPFTATFEYEVSGIKDSVFCDFGVNERRYLPPENSLINFFYKKTGIYNVHFFTSSQILDSLRIIAYSKDWQGGYFPNDQPNKFVPFYDQSLYRQADCFYAPLEKLKEERIDLKEDYWTSYKLFSPFNKSLDHLTMETHVLNNESTGSYLCYDIDVSLIGDSGLVELKFTQPKCSRYAKLIFSEQKMNGEFNKLDAMSVNLSDWLKIKVITENKNFNLYLSDSLVFEGQYKNPMGKLLGIVYSFYGSGKIDFLELKDGAKNTFLKDNFSRMPN